MNHSFNIKMRLVLWILLGGCGLVSAPPMAYSQSHCQSYWTAAYKCSQGCGSCGSSSGGNSGSGLPPGTRWIFEGLFSGPSAAEKADQQARAANERGVQAYKNGDWATAIALFQQALQNDPGDPTYTQNLTNAQNNLANQQARERVEREALDRQRANQIAANNMQQSIQNFAQTLNAAPISGGLDFDGRTLGSAPSGSTSGGLDFTASVAMPSQARPAPVLPSSDPMVVDARVPRDGTYLTNQVPELKNSPAADRITKGFQAVTMQDWPVALAWWQDALNRDPSNAALKRSVDLAQWMVDKRKATVAGPVTPLGAAIHSAARGDTAGAIRQFELAKAAHPASAPQIEDMVKSLRQRQAKDAKDAKSAAYWNSEIERGQRQLVDAMLETGMNMLSVGNEKGAQDAFRDADLFSMGLSAGGQKPSQVSSTKTK